MGGCARLAECLALSLVFLIAGAAFAAPWEGQSIVHVAHQPMIAGERRLSDSELADAITFKPGQPYQAKLIGESIERLFATGRFVDIEATAEPADGGVAITFITRGQYFAGDVRVLGVQAPPSEIQLRVAAGVELGSPVGVRTLEDSATKIRSLLEEHGYFQSEVKWSEVRNPDTQQSSITFQVKTRERARLGGVRLEGQPVFTAEQILRRAKWRVGGRADAATLQDGLARLREMYHDEGYLQASLAVTGREYHADTNRVDWVFTVAAGMRVEILVKGADLSQSKIRQLVPIFQEGSVDEDLIREGERNLRTFFESEGYFDAAVEAIRQQNGPDLVTIRYEVNSGERHRLRSVLITGNQYFRIDAIREQLQIEPARTLAHYGTFSRQMLEADVDRIRSLYVENGFGQVDVSGTPQVAAENAQDIDVIIKITEGPQTLIGDLVIEGPQSFTENEIKELINADPGQPYSESLVTSDGNTILTFYLNEGYPEARFRAETASHDGQVALKYVIDEGSPSYIANIFVGDLRYTQRGIVNRQIQVRPGEPVSQGRLLDTQRRLYDLGIFSRVDIGVQNPSGSTTEKNILLYLEEARRYTFKLGLGAEIGRFGGAGSEGVTEFSPDVSFSISRLNFAGRPHTLGLRGRFSALQRRAGMNYTAPRLFNAPWLTGTLLAFYDQTRDVKTFTARRWEGSLQFEVRRSRITTVLARYSFRRVSVDENSLRISPDQIPLVSQPVLVGMAGITWLRDTRNSAGSPTRGVFYSLDLALAARPLASEASFARGLIQHSSYYRLPAGFTLVRSTQFGAQAPFGKQRQVVVDSDTAQMELRFFTREIPIAERFFSGGGSTHRGFGLNQAGPRDLNTGFAVGGNALLVNTVELRHSVWQNLVGVLFHDMGNVFASVGDVTLNSMQKKPGDFNYLQHALGLGVRYETAVAPIRFDVGYALNPTRYPVVTDSGPETRSLTRWQFLFSVGQTF